VIFAGKEGCKHQWVPMSDGMGGMVMAATGLYWFKCRVADCGRIQTSTHPRGPKYEDPDPPIKRTP
jgi:hypothetical protein